MPFVLDASVALAWCFDDEASPIAQGAADRVAASDSPVVPITWFYEVTNAVLATERRHRLTPDAAMRALQLLEAIPFTLDDPSLSRIWSAVLEAARRYGLSTYDASYLELAIREQLPLATLDRALERAAREAGVELVA